MLLWIIVSVALCACGPDEDSAPDDAPPATRIVSLSPSFTETLFRLGRGDRVVGRTRWCDTPEAARSLPAVSDAFSVHVEALVALRPDAVVANSRGLIDALGPLRERFQVSYVRNDSVEDVLTSIRTLGRLAEAEEEARAMVADIEQAIAAARDRNESRERPRVLFIADHDPFYVAGGASYVGALLALAGGENVAGDLDESYPTMSLETILTRRPEVIIEGGRGGDEGNDEAVRFWSRFPDLPAVRSARVVRLPSDAVNRPGPRLPLAIRELEAMIHPPTPPEDER